MLNQNQAWSTAWIPVTAQTAFRHAPPFRYEHNAAARAAVVFTHAAALMDHQAEIADHQESARTMAVTACRSRRSG